MKLNKFFLLGMAGLAFAACSNEDDVAFNAGDGVNKTMVVSIAGISSGTTRATAPTDPWVKDEAGQGVNNINKIFLAFTDASGVVKYVYNTEDHEGSLANLKGNGMKFTNVEDVTAVYAVANAPASFNLAVGSKINSVNTQFSEQSINTVGAKNGGVVYVGGDTDIQPLASEPAEGFNDDNTHDFDTEIADGSYYYSAAITLRPILSRIQINSVKVATSGESNTFPATSTATISAGQYKYTWSGFEPSLFGVYLNNFYSVFTDLTGVASAPLGEDTYQNNIVNGQWLLDGTDYADHAAYISYAEDAYGDLLTYGEGVAEGAITYSELMPEGKCIGFNVFVPFNIVTGTTESDMNPTIHFQFDSKFSGYTKTPVYAIATGGHNVGEEVTDPEELAYVNGAEENIDLTLPLMNDYMFANIRNLYTNEAASDALQMEPGKIYNMNVVINPVNMQYDLTVQETNNVVVTIDVVDFSEQTIYPGLDE